VNRKGGDAGSYRCIVQTPTGAVSSKTVTLLTAGKYFDLIYFFLILYIIVDIAFCFHVVTYALWLNSTSSLSGIYLAILCAMIICYILCIIYYVSMYIWNWMIFKLWFCFLRIRENTIWMYGFYYYYYMKSTFIAWS